MRETPQNATEFTSIYRKGAQHILPAPMTEPKASLIIRLLPAYRHGKVNGVAVEERASLGPHQIIALLGTGCMGSFIARRTRG